MRAKNELIFGLVGPIGCPIQGAAEALSRSLKSVGYTTSEISVSNLIEILFKAKNLKLDSTFESVLEEKILKGNAVRKDFKNDAIMAAEVIREIRDRRLEIYKERSLELGDRRTIEDNDLMILDGSENPLETDSGPGEVSIEDYSEELKATPIEGHAFIVRQLKRSEEVELFVKVFGKRFVQVSVVTELPKRIAALEQRLKVEQSGWTNKKCLSHAADLIEKDQNEKLDVHGQRISKVFHLADVFLDGRTSETLKRSSDRFVDAFFGATSISPTKDEFGSYMAKAVSLRSVDLSRQVGAVISSRNGDIISTGCNEVPRPGGGNYWDEDDEKRRDVDIGGEANKSEVNRIVFDFLEVLVQQKLIHREFTVESILSDTKHKNAIKESLVSGITEYGRMVHAEMNALCDAARLGRSVSNATIYVTTYPCHNCAKHIIAAGISRIVFVEPYPKSKVETLFQRMIEADAQEEELVSIEHFFGISPRRYRDIFEKSERQTKTGEVQKWYQGSCAPILGPTAVIGTDQEAHALRDNLYPQTTTSLST